jgi:hypothetical protein
MAVLMWSLRRGHRASFGTEMVDEPIPQEREFSVAVPGEPMINSRDHTQNLLGRDRSVQVAGSFSEQLVISSMQEYTGGADQVGDRRKRYLFEQGDEVLLIVDASHEPQDRAVERVASHALGEGELPHDTERAQHAVPWLDSREVRCDESPEAPAAGTNPIGIEFGSLLDGLANSMCSSLENSGLLSRLPRMRASPIPGSSSVSVASPRSRRGCSAKSSISLIVSRPWTSTTTGRRSPDAGTRGRRKRSLFVSMLSPSDAITSHDRQVYKVSPAHHLALMDSLKSDAVMLVLINRSYNLLLSWCRHINAAPHRGIHERADGSPIHTRATLSMEP